MKLLRIYIHTIYNLGITNVLSVLWYRIITNSFIVKILFKETKQSQFSEIFLPILGTREEVGDGINTRIIKYADEITNGNIVYYSHKSFNVGSPPNWFLNPYNGNKFIDSNMHWSDIKDFDTEIGDIKNIWEASRFNWVGTLAYSYKISQNENYLITMNEWLKDWTKHNPPNTGPNWKCGQEASIRVINLLIAYEILGYNKPTNDLIEILELHINRILPSTFYAKAQNNNHGVSEGIALFLGGYFLSKNTKLKKYNSVHGKGLSLLENRVTNLIMDDGTFAQYSTAYHRMVLDLLSIPEIFRERWSLSTFSEKYYTKVKLAVNWYSSMMDSISGDMPNIGGNDGTHLFNYNLAEYRDFRQTLSLVSAVYNFPIQKKLQQSHILQKIFNKKNELIDEKHDSSIEFAMGGFVKLARENGMSILRVPKFKFRPPHSDALHIDIWQNGKNWVRDSGTYSYALLPEDTTSFDGTIGHSTIQFNHKDQMPKISRFLYGKWLDPSHTSFDNVLNKTSASYIDVNKLCHSRSIKEISNGWVIKDKVSGVFKNGILQYILHPEDWNITENGISCTEVNILFQSDQEFSISIGKRYESKYYMNKTNVPILQLEFFKPGSITTKILFTI